ncbi:MAG TPA: apolipoprotein N-acyltransferase, partial [Beijerinckiaceae bacterium]|nr:apolipoprotein N-acyltransferase [Beijerinckiaceae bacterium]
YFVAGLWWLGAAFLVEADQFAWALPFGVLGLPAVLAGFSALGFALSRALWSPGAGRLFAFAFGLTVAEWLRGTAFTGFPWNTIGMAFGQNLWLMQAASAVGLYGLTILAILICAAPATLGTGDAGSRRWAAPGLAVSALALLAAFGAWRVPRAATPTVAGVKLRIMQPNLPQDAKFSLANRDAVMRRYLSISDRATSPTSNGVADATHLIWPESAFPFLLHRDAKALAQIAALLPPGATLITGAARADDPPVGEEPSRYFNAIQVVSHEGAIIATYDKAHLVPFGEYFPHFLDAALRSFGLRQFVHVPGGFDAGESRRPLAVPGLPPVAPTICYEAIFPGAVVLEGTRPGLILNVTNDAWFGITPGPHQHYAQARLRAVEEGLPLVRAANNGISAVIDPYGRASGLIPLGVEGVLDAGLPTAIWPTSFSNLGRIFFTTLLLSCGASALVARRKPRPSQKRRFGQ